MLDYPRWLPPLWHTGNWKSSPRRQSKPPWIWTSWTSRDKSAQTSNVTQISVGGWRTLQFVLITGEGCWVIHGSYEHNLRTWMFFFRQNTCESFVNRCPALGNSSSFVEITASSTWLIVVEISSWGNSFVLGVDNSIPTALMGGNCKHVSRTQVQRK